MIPPNRTTLEWVLVLVRGMAMGAADVVPGVSGGTIAFITGIYSELLHSLSQINVSALLVLKSKGIMAAWRHINGTFLLVLFSGVLVSLITLARVIKYGLAEHPIVVWSFFFGLILASIVFFARKQNAWAWKDWLLCLIGAALVLGIALASPAQMPGTWWMMFLGGFVAICAMILPGISGSFILLLAGLYSVFINALTDFDWALLFSFGIGAILGLLSFTRVLTWLLDHHEKRTMATLIGFLIGSLYVTWPWKYVVETRINRHGELVPWIRENVMPLSYEQMTGNHPMIVAALASLVFGVVLVLSTEYFSELKNKSSN